jgi:hypothetical protein
LAAKKEAFGGAWEGFKLAAPWTTVNLAEKWPFKGIFHDFSLRHSLDPVGVL